MYKNPKKPLYDHESQNKGIERLLIQPHLQMAKTKEFAFLTIDQNMGGSALNC